MVSRDEILEYWNRDDVESMYDKHLLSAEIRLIKARLAPNTKILDVGCGDGEATLAYSWIPGITVHAIDFAETRLRKAERRLRERPNVVLKQVDLLGQYVLDGDYDAIISQRCLINLPSWGSQKRVLLDLMVMLRPGGILLTLEGSLRGVESLNEFRAALGLEPIPIKWHNVFVDNEALVKFMSQNGFRLREEDGLGSYFLLTRGIRPYFEKELDWNCEFNRFAATEGVSRLFADNTGFSRLKLWVFEK